VDQPAASRKHERLSGSANMDGRYLQGSRKEGNLHPESLEGKTWIHSQRNSRGLSIFSPFYPCG
jgi:hypothetical protein